METVLPFEKIFPYIRYAQLLDFKDSIHNPFFNYILKSYDHRLFYVLKGKGIIQVDNTRYNASKGQLFLWQACTSYYLKSDTQDYLKLIGLSFDYTQNNIDKTYTIPPKKDFLFNKSSILESIHFSDVQAFNKPIFLSNMQILENNLLSILDEFNAKKKFYNQKICSLFLSVLNDIARVINSIDIGHNNKDSKIDMIIQYIHENYNKDINNESIGKLFNFHPNYINKLMVVNTGMSLHKYLLMHRISQAINLIQTTNMPISEVAYAVGFNNPNHFSKQLRAKTGRTPGDFRKAPIQ